MTPGVSASEEMGNRETGGPACDDRDPKDEMTPGDDSDMGPEKE